MGTEEQLEDKQELSPQVNTFNPQHFPQPYNSFITGFKARLGRVLVTQQDTGTDVTVDVTDDSSGRSEQREMRWPSMPTLCRRWVVASSRNRNICFTPLIGFSYSS